MNAVAYCRVSTNKEEQLDSLASQRKFFAEYCRRNGYRLMKIYADEGKSGTKMKNRVQLLRLLSDAERGEFRLVLIKDVSRLARNTVDFLTSIRKMKFLGIKVVFVNYDQTSSDSSEFMLTMLSAIAQEESANTSRRVKFGKKQNAEKGRVPNIVYGYDKIPGDYFHLRINPIEAGVVRKIFQMYVGQELGAGKIAEVLNKEGFKTKRGCPFTQNAVQRILTNELYIGSVVNARQEVEDFLTGKRRSNNEKDWLRTNRPELRLIDDETFLKAGDIRNSRSRLFHSGFRLSERNLFSKLIRCGSCGASFRRQERTYKNTYIRWVCSGRNAKGAGYCPNKTALEEDTLLAAIRAYLSGFLQKRSSAPREILREFSRQFCQKDESATLEKELESLLVRAKKTRMRYLSMYEAEIITLEELRGKASELDLEISRLTNELGGVREETDTMGLAQTILAEILENAGEMISNQFLTSSVLHSLIESIEVDENQRVTVHLKSFHSPQRGKIVPITDDRT